MYLIIIMPKLQIQLPDHGDNIMRGFTLIEVLIAMLIVAIGVLGITALQFKGLQYNQNASFRTQVSVLAYDISERMRTNAANAVAYADAITDYLVPAVEPSGCVHAGAFSTGVTNDVNCWKQQLYQALPPGSTASVSDDGDGLYTVTIGWFDRENSETDPLVIAYTFRP
jgi:type IV pilus assembly protein PilV